MESSNFIQYPTVKERGAVFYGFETIQLDVEHFLHTFLEVPAEAIRTIIIVGAWKGDEIASFLKYQNAVIHCFEPNPITFKALKARYKNEHSVICYPYACGASNSTAVLHETDSSATDSLLKISEKAEFKEVRTASVEVRRLDGIPALQHSHVDLLWADVQGYELEVLKGAEGLLPQVSSMFLEVNRNLYQYQGAVPYEHLNTYVQSFGFQVVAEGLDETKQGGNALFMKKQPGSLSYMAVTVKDRLQPYLRRMYLKKRLFSLPFADQAVRLAPAILKTFIKKILGS